MGLESLIEFLSTKYPMVLQILVIMGLSRSILKPIMVAAKEIVGVTPTKKDDELLTKVEGSKAYSMLVFVLDYIFSLKLPK